MGEIGINRNEYLYEFDYCDIILISRGYWRRFHTSWQQARLIAYHIRYCMGVGKNEDVKSMSQWLPFPWENANDGPHLSESEIEELRAEMDYWNSQL